MKMMRCPNCGAVLVFSKELDLYVCEYCGYNQVITERVVYQKVPAASKKTNNRSQAGALSIVAFIFSLTFVLSFWGMVLGAIDMRLSTKNGEKANALSVVAFTMGLTFWSFGFLFWGLALRTL
ncbi:MAG: hypothetical protein J6Y08_09175 [Clostridiales bacterium]|nr:hypothetical protein [Clostridiales bacterium]